MPLRCTSAERWNDSGQAPVGQSADHGLLGALCVHLGMCIQSGLDQFLYRYDRLTFCLDQVREQHEVLAHMLSPTCTGKVCPAKGCYITVYIPVTSDVTAEV